MLNEAVSERPKTNKPAEVVDLGSYFESFKNSALAQQNIDSRCFLARVQGKPMPWEIAEEEYLGSAHAPEDLRKFYLNQPVKFDRKGFSATLRSKLSDYYKKASLWANRSRGVYESDFFLMSEDEVERHLAHLSAARQLVIEGTAPTLAIGQTMIFLIAKSEGHDNF